MFTRGRVAFSSALTGYAGSQRKGLAYSCWPCHGARAVVGRLVMDNKTVRREGAHPKRFVQLALELSLDDFAWAALFGWHQRGSTRRGASALAIEVLAGLHDCHDLVEVVVSQLERFVALLASPYYAAVGDIGSCSALYLRFM